MDDILKSIINLILFFLMNDYDVYDFKILLII